MSTYSYYEGISNVHPLIMKNLLIWLNCYHGQTQLDFEFLDRTFSRKNDIISSRNAIQTDINLKGKEAAPGQNKHRILLIYVPGFLSCSWKYIRNSTCTLKIQICF